MSDELVSIAGEIRREHEAATRAAESALEHARRCGELLVQAREAVPHGGWLPWLSEHCPEIPERTAQAYMRIARRWPEIEDVRDPQRVADLPIRKALALLAEPRCSGTDDEPSETPWMRFYRTMETIADEGEADEAALAAIGARLDTVEAGSTPRQRERRQALVREITAIMHEARRLSVRAGERQLRAERALGCMLIDTERDGWTWPRFLLEMDEGALDLFLDMCEERIATMEAEAR